MEPQNYGSAVMSPPLVDVSFLSRSNIILQEGVLFFSSCFLGLNYKARTSLTARWPYDDTDIDAKVSTKPRNLRLSLDQRL